eukprot:5995613-Amphidinium_carterae.2
MADSPYLGAPGQRRRLPHTRHDQSTCFCLGYRQQGWIPTTYRIGEAKTPGPTICSANPGGWSRIDGVLNLKHDIVAVQETFVLRDHLASA